MKLNRVLFAAPMGEGSSCIPRMKGLQRLGLDVEVLDTGRLLMQDSRILNSITQRFPFTSAAREMNAALLGLARQIHPDVTWIEKGTWVYPSTLRHLKKHSRHVVHHHTDDVTSTFSFWLHRVGVGLYDLHMTTNRWNVLEFRERMGLKIFRTGMGYDQDFHLPPEPFGGMEWKHEAVIIGHWEPHSERHISALRKAGISVEVWGHNWRKAKDPALRSVKPLAHGDYLRTIASAKIALCFLSRQNRNESTGRSFEIPSIGTFLLAQRTLEHEYLYRDGVGAALFSDERELLEKTTYFLTHDRERMAVAAAGHTRCRELGLSWGDHMKREWPLAEDCLLNGRMPVSGTDDSPFWQGFRDGLPAPSVREIPVMTGGVS